MDVAVKQLKRNSNYTVYNALIRIRKEFIKEANGVSSLRKAGGLKSLLYHIQTPEEKIVDVALSILGNCCLEQETRKLVRELDGVSVVVRNLECFKNESILNRSCRVLANLALDESNADEIHRQKAAELIINVLSKAKDCNLLQSALRALRILSNVPRHREIVIKRGGVECLGKMLVEINSETNDNVLMGILKALSILAVDSSSWVFCNCLRSEYVEALVSQINDTRAQETALHIMSNLSKEETFRPILGNADIVPVLIKRVNQWETSSLGWQWAVDCLCQCTREAVNRARIRQGGGIELLIRLLKDHEDDKLWRRGLASIINFEYDDSSFRALVELGMVEAIIGKFIQLTSDEELVVHRDDELPSINFQAYGENNDEKKDNNSFGNSHDNFEQQMSPHSECYSPEFSPSYCFSFGPLSPPNNHPALGYSPGRSISPHQPEQLDEFCYSPVYEWDDNDDSDIEASSPRNLEEEHPGNGVEMEEEVSRTEVTPVEDVKIDEIVKNGELTGRSPLGDIFRIFSRLSSIENPTAIFLNNDVLVEILNYITKVKSVQQKSIRIVNRILRNSLCFEKIILLRFPSFIVRNMIKSSHGSHSCLPCANNCRLGEAFLNDLSSQAECSFGYGVFQHILDSATFTFSEKISAVVAAAILIRSYKGRRKIFIESAGISLLTGDLSAVEGSDFNEITNSLALFASGIQTDVKEMCAKKDPSAGTSKCCYLFPKLEEENRVDLRATDVVDVISVVRQTFASKSEVLSAMLCGSFKESTEKVVTIQNTCFIALKCFVHYTYSCRTNSCPILDFTVNREPVAVFCDILSLADRFLMFEVKDFILADIIERHKRISYSPTEVADILNTSKIHNCSVLESWAVSHLLTDVYDNFEERQIAFNILTSDRLLTKEELQSVLTNQLLKSENEIQWPFLKQELHCKFF